MIAIEWADGYVVYEGEKYRVISAFKVGRPRDDSPLETAKTRSFVIEKRIKNAMGENHWYLWNEVPRLEKFSLLQAEMGLLHEILEKFDLDQGQGDRSYEDRMRR